jgi:hypothetical protein
MVALYLPIVIVTSQAHRYVQDQFGGQAQVVALVHLAIFASAVAMGCLVRQAVYAAILSIPVLYVGLIAVWLADLAAKRLGWTEVSAEHVHELTEGQIAVGMLINVAISILVAWLAVRHDWGRKTRY